MKHSVTETGSAGTLTGTLPPPPAATERMLLIWQIQQEQKTLDMLTAFLQNRDDTGDGGGQEHCVVGNNQRTSIHAVELLCKVNV